jgi:protocatechuate 3,4-dioxygenase beta subunit
MRSHLTLFLVLSVFFFAACVGQNQGTDVLETSTTMQEVVIAVTDTNIPPTEMQEPLPSATITAQPTTSTAPIATATAIALTTDTPEPTQIACDGVLTSPQQEGPFFSPGSPERESLIETDMPGVPVQIIGRVFDQDCNPIPRAKLDFWLADVDGQYDNVGFTLRGHVFSDQDGFYLLESIEPTSYTGRPPHIHIKVYAPTGEELLTTQMYFAGSEDSAEVTNAPELFVNYLNTDEYGRQQILFNFVIAD